MSMKKNNSSSHDAAHEDPPQISKTTKGEQISELTRSLYDPIMSSVDTLKEEQIAEKCSKFGIFYDKTKFYASLTKSCLKTDWQSIVYEIKYGNFKTELKIISVDLDSSSLCSNFLTRGGFGQIFKFQISSQEQYILKNIKYQRNNSEQIDMALKEVFMAKVFSALEAGPKFVKLFSYDAVVYRNCIQFAMEMCRTDYQQLEIQNELKRKRLLVLLKTIHSIGICHMDIKNQNICWSPAYKKFVFLDFTFTRFIEEPIGKKTLTSFFGTYMFCSPDMKKRYHLQNRSYVDLYYNDLYGLQQSWNEMAEPQKVKLKQKVALFKNFQSKPMNLNQVAQNAAIINYFKVKLHIFEEDFREAVSIIEKDKVLASTFHKIIQKHEKKFTKNNFHLQLIKYAHKQDSLKINQILFSYELQIQNDFLAANLLEIVVEISQSDELFKKAWEEEFYRQKMFFFIDVYSNPDRDENMRKSLIEKIYHKIGHSEEASDTIKFRRVLIFYGEFFQKKQNIDVLEKIMSYFALMQDHWNREKLEDKILSFFERQENYLSFYERNLKYFLGKIATLDSRSNYFGQKYIQNAQKLLEILNKSSKNQKDSIEKIKQTVKFMKIIAKLKFNRVQKSQFQKYVSLFSGLQFENVQISQFILLLLCKELLTSVQSNSFQPSIQIKQSGYKDHYLEKCAFIRETQNNIAEQRVFSARTLLQRQVFMKNFSTLFHLFTINYFSSPQLRQSKLICKDYLKMCQNCGKKFNQPYFVALILIGQINQAENYVITYLNEFQLSQIDSLQQVKNFMTILFNIFSKLLKIQTYGYEKLSQEGLRKLGDMLQPFLQYIGEQCIFEYSLPQNMPKKQLVIQSKKRRYSYNRKTIKSILHFLVGNKKQATTIILHLVQQFQDKNYYISTFQLICCIERKSQGKQLQRIREAIFSMCSTLITQSQFQTLMIIPEHLEAILKIYQSKQMTILTFGYFSQICSFINRENINFLQTAFFSTILKFMETWSRNELKTFILNNIKLKLSQLQNYPLLTYFSYFALEISDQDNFLQPNDKKRLLIICIILSKHLDQGYFRNYKKNLYHQNRSLTIKNSIVLSQIRKQTERRSVKSYVDCFIYLNKRKSKAFYNKKLIETLTQKTNERAKRYYKYSDRQSFPVK